MGSHSLLHGIFLTQGSNPGLPHCRQILYQLSHKGSLRILEWVDYHFSRGSFWPGIELWSPALQVDSLPTELTGNIKLTLKKCIPIYIRCRQVLFESTYISYLHACLPSCFSCIWHITTLWTVAHQAPLSVGFSRQEYWMDWYALFQGNFPTQGSNLCLLHLLHWHTF